MEFIFDNIYLAVFVISIFFVLMGIRIANENERFVVIVPGRYVGIKGPGLLLKWPNSSLIWHKVALNDDGYYLGDGMVKVRDAVFLAENTGSIRIGAAVKFSSFKNDHVTIVESA